MPLVSVKLVEGVFSAEQKHVEEVKSGDWGIAGNPLTIADIALIPALLGALAGAAARRLLAGPDGTA
jgi:hypothetical protein